MDGRYRATSAPAVRRFPRLPVLTDDDEKTLISIRRLLSESRDWTRPRPRELNAAKFKDEIRRNRSVKGWINSGNIWLDGKLTVRDPYGATDIRLHTCDKFLSPGGEYCEVLGHFSCSECWQMTNKRCLEDNLPAINYELLTADRPLSAPWKVISAHRRALRLQSAATSEARKSMSASSSKLDAYMTENKISDILEEERNESVFLTQTEVGEHENEAPKKRESLKPVRKVFRNDLKFMCPPIVSIHQTRTLNHQWG